MTNTFRWALLTCIFAVVLGGCVNAPYSTSGRVVVQGDHGMIDIAFSDHDRELLREHYGYKHKSKHKHLPPGLAKKDKLPPGLQKQLVRRGELPPGLQYRRLPNELDRRLSRIPDGYLRAMIGGSFVLFNENTRVIFDVIHDL
ncbi:MAG: hypothetical protein KAT93_05765 [Desulfuromonadales bacterium]|nr:hypothetical protein [Desulfuromonadales bacterium]